MESLSPFLWGSFIPYNMPVVPKTSAAEGFGFRARFCNLDREPQASKTSEVMVSSTLPSSLLRSVFSTTKWHFLFQHAVNNEQHEMGNRHNRPLFPSPRVLIAGSGREIQNPSYGLPGPFRSESSDRSTRLNGASDGTRMLNDRSSAPFAGMHNMNGL